MGLIYFIVTLLLLLLFLLMLMFSVALKIKFILDTNNSNLDLYFLWLYPFLKAIITIENEKPMLTIYLFKVKIFKMAVKAQKGNTNGSNLMQLVDTTDIDVTTAYGFKDLYITGVASGIVSAVKGFINASYIKQFPDFTTTDDYIYVNASAKVNIGSTLVNFTKNKIKG